MVSADLNWWGAYGALVDAGYRVLAIDHRGHGRGLRSILPFRLSDCAADAAAALELLSAAPAIVVGYSMGGAIAQLVAHDHPELVSGLVLSGTAHDWSDPKERWFWRSMGLLWATTAVAPYWMWRTTLGWLGFRDPQIASWLITELLRASARDIAEAGRELGRFDSRRWIGSLDVPAAVIVTTKDRIVSPRKQRSLAAALGAKVFEAPVDHLEVVKPGYVPALLEAVETVAAGGLANSPRAAAGTRQERAASG
jgi:pimeloyl-ACP methyl ester carboxylesterase